MIPAGTRETTTFDRMATRYGVDRSAALGWSKEPGFPEYLQVAGSGNMEIYDADAVDEWVRKNKPTIWARAQGGENPLGLPEGGPKDLLTLREIGEIEGKALGRPATEIGTLRPYITRGVLARPDRRPGDRGTPVVTEDSWYRETAYAYINRPRRTRKPSTRRPSAEVKASRPQIVFPEDQLQPLDLPPGADTDLLTLEQIGVIDGEARRGPGKVTKKTSLNTYIREGKLCEAERRPGDGKHPAVTEPSWYRSTVYRFVRRPDGRGQRRRS